MTAGPSVALELHPALLTATGDTAGKRMADALAAGVTEVMRGFGIPGQANAELRGKDGPRAACVFVDGRVTPYPAAFVRRLWSTHAAPELQALAFDGDGIAAGPFPDAWLIAYAARSSDDEMLRGLLLELVRAVVSLRPSVLLVSAAAGDAGEDDPRLVVGRALLDRGVTLPPLERLGALLEQHAAMGRSAADALEDLYARLRARAIEIHLHPGRLALLVGDPDADGVPVDDPRLDADMLAAIEAIRDHHLAELGVRLPIVLVASGDVEADEMRVRLNDRLAPPVPIPRHDEVGVSAPASRLLSGGIDARPLVDATTGHEFAAVRAEDADDARRVIGTLPALPDAYLAAAIGRSISPLAHRLLSVEEVESDLAALEEAFPSLVHGALARFSLTAITQVVRELVREQVSIRNTWAILNALMCCSYLEGSRGSDTGHRDEVDERVVAFVRRQLRDRVAYDAGLLELMGSGEAHVYVTDEAFERRLVELGGASDREPGLTGVRNDVWGALGSSPPAEPVFVTSTAARRPLREAVAYELPGARVVSRSELPPELEVQAIAVVAG